MCKDPALARALRDMAPPRVLLNHRVTAPDDHDALLPEEQAALAARAVRVRRQSGAARIAAREILHEFGFGDTAIPHAASGAPVMPPGFIGSLAHDETIAVAAVARSSAITALGIDVEPDAPLPPELVKVVATEQERRTYQTAILESRLLFALKEATYKALNPVDGRFLEFADIEIDLEKRQGLTRHGTLVELAFITAPRIVAVAFKTAD